MVYWLQFLLSFVALPLFVEFEAMDYIPQQGQRLVKSLYEVMKVYALYAAVGALAYGAWYLFASGAQISFSQLGMTLGVVWGFI